MLNSVLNGDWSNSVPGRQIPERGAGMSLCPPPIGLLSWHYRWSLRRLAIVRAPMCQLPIVVWLLKHNETLLNIVNAHKTCWNTSKIIEHRETLIDTQGFTWYLHAGHGNVGIYGVGKPRGRVIFAIWVFFPDRLEYWLDCLSQLSALTTDWQSHPHYYTKVVTNNLTINTKVSTHSCSSNNTLTTHLEIVFQEQVSLLETPVRTETESEFSTRSLLWTFSNCHVIISDCYGIIGNCSVTKHQSLKCFNQHKCSPKCPLLGVPLCGGCTLTPEPVWLKFEPVGSNRPHLSFCSEPCGLEQRTLGQHTLGIASVPQGMYVRCCAVHISLVGYYLPNSGNLLIFGCW